MKKNNGSVIIGKIAFVIMVILILFYVPFAWLAAIAFVTIKILLSMFDDSRRHHRRH